MDCSVVFTLFAPVLLSSRLRSLTSTSWQVTAVLISLTPASESSSLSPTEELLKAIRREEELFTHGGKTRSKRCKAFSREDSAVTERTREIARHLADEEAHEKAPRFQLYPVRILVADLVFDAQNRATLMQKLKEFVERSCGLIEPLGPFGGVKIELPSGIEDKEIVEILNALREEGQCAYLSDSVPPDVHVFEANYAEYMSEGLEAEPDFLVRPAGKIIPNDPLFGNLWGLYEVDLPAAWELHNTAGLRHDARPIVCVSDSGVDYTHEDLYRNIYFNNAESLGVPDVDDDNNGYVDDIYGINVYDAGEANDPMDTLSHGTHVAGTLGAVGNNGKGVTGVAWNARIIPCKFIGESGGVVSGAAQCIEYCVSRGAKVSVHSYTLSSMSKLLLAAMSWAEARGLIMIFAGGNQGADTGLQPSYPACFTSELDGAIAVANLSRPGGAPVLDSGSNYGKCVQLGCPGTNILSTLSRNKGEAYGMMCGTSMAAALMAGIVTLMVAANPDLSPGQCRKYIKNCIERLPNLVDDVEWGGMPSSRCCVRAALNGSPSRFKLSRTSLATVCLGLVLAYLVGS